MAHKRRFEPFADFLVTRFPRALHVFDVARGGMGKFIVDEATFLPMAGRERMLLGEPSAPRSEMN